MCFVRESVLRRLNRIPRKGSDQSFRDPVTGLPNDNVHEPLERFDGSKTCFVFISHLWLRAGHPDTVDNQMCKLILSAFSGLRGPHSAPVPEDFEFAVWIDFSCLDQDTVSAQTLAKKLASLRHKLERERERESIECALDGVSLTVHNVLPKELIRPSIVPAPWCSHSATLAIQQCDLFLIPVVDPDYLKWSRPMMVTAKNGQDSSINRFKNGQLESFEPAGWQDYLERAWCRLEMMEAAA
jgi:hypothetical protein